MVSATRTPLYDGNISRLIRCRYYSHRRRYYQPSLYARGARFQGPKTPLVTFYTQNQEDKSRAHI